MSVLSFGIMVLMSSCLILFLSSLISFIQFILLKNELKRYSSKPPKEKKKKRKWRILREQTLKRRKKKIVSGIVFMLLSICTGALVGYGLYYQSINLSAEDEKGIVSSYYLLRDFQKEVEKAGAQSESEDASQQNIRYLATSLAAFTTNKASTVNTTEGQSVLNRYYASLAQLGLNATRESTNFYGNPTLVEEFQADIAKVIEYESAAFDYFKINQGVLESEDINNEE